MNWIVNFLRFIAFVVGLLMFGASCLFLKLDLGCSWLLFLGGSALCITWAVLPFFRERP